MSAVRDELASLRELHSTLLAAAQENRRVAADVVRSLDDTVWTGPRAQSFGASWTSLTGTLATALDQAADDVQTQHNNLAAATGEPDSI